MSKRSLLRSHLPECEEGGDARDALGFFILTQGSFTCDVGLLYTSNRSLLRSHLPECQEGGDARDALGFFTLT